MKSMLDPKYGARPSGGMNDTEIVAALVVEARRLGAGESGADTLSDLLARDAAEGVKAAAKYFGETAYCDPENLTLLQFFLRGIIDRTYGQIVGGVFQAPAIFEDAASEQDGSRVSGRGLAGDGLPAATVARQPRGQDAKAVAEAKEARAQARAGALAAKKEQAAEKVAERARAKADAEAAKVAAQQQLEAALAELDQASLSPYGDG